MVGTAFAAIPANNNNMNSLRFPLSVGKQQLCDILSTSSEQVSKRKLQKILGQDFICKNFGSLAAYNTVRYFTNKHLSSLIEFFELTPEDFEIKPKHLK